MTGWIVFGAVLLLLLLLLCCPVSVRLFAAQESLSIRLAFLFIRYDLSPDALAARAEKRKAKPQKEKKAKEKAPDTEEPDKKKKAAGKSIWTLIKSSQKGLNLFRRHLIFSKVKIYLSVGAEDAHQTALRYSQFCMLAAGLLDVIGLLFVLKKPQTVIMPDFLRPGIRYEISMRVSIRPIFVLAAGCSIFYQYLRAQPAPKHRKIPVKPTATKSAG